MTITPTRIFPLGDNAVTVEFGNEISLSLNDASVALANALHSNPFQGFIEAVPAIASTTVYYDPRLVSGPLTGKYGVVRTYLREVIDNLAGGPLVAGRRIEVPVDFGPDAALDRESIESFSGLQFERIIEIFLSREYRVYMLGFLPGFAYMGIVDERISAPRRQTPRKLVPKGSVGIAGRQTGIYPSESPGGWQIIGRTDLELLIPNGVRPCLFSAGDDVRFVRS